MPLTQDPSTRPNVESTFRLAELVTDAVPRRYLQGKRVLWVDDRPEGNRYEMLALKEFGVDVTTARSTSEALDLLSRATFDLVISDMKRGVDDDAGYDLLGQLLTHHILIRNFLHSVEIGRASRPGTRCFWCCHQSFRFDHSHDISVISQPSASSS